MVRPWNYITGKFKSIYAKKKKIGLELLKINITSIPLYKNAFEVVVILFGPWSSETWDNNIFFSILWKCMQIF